MSTLFWIVMIYLGGNIAYQWYMVDRTRTKTTYDAFCATGELVILALAIYALAN